MSNTIANSGSLEYPVASLALSAPSTLEATPTNAPKSGIATSPKSEPYEHLVLYDVSWELYQHLLKLCESRRLRHTYSNGTLEIMSPRKRHDRIKGFVARLVGVAAYELGIAIQPIASTTLDKEELDQGIEPDESYYIQHEALVRDQDDYDPSRDPPPDLSIEVEETRTVLSRMATFMKLKIPEIWRVSADYVKFFQLEESGYVEISRSRALPFIESKMLAQLIQKRNLLNQNELITEFLDYLRQQRQSN
ncbi:MAG: Uma2 family endonuclease [Pirellulales bacterium]|nr:Uma2 family endonuclease [Pirellulales bacterium]